MPAHPAITFLETCGSAILVEITETRGSSPRESGAFMIVSSTRHLETIGGGQFEYIAIDHARAMLKDGRDTGSLDIPLGPEIGQCCGGRTLLSFTRVLPQVIADLKTRLEMAQSDQPAVFIFGAGHVGKALASSLSLLPMNVTIIETRKAELHDLPPDVGQRLVAMPEALVSEIPAGGAAIIVTHDHALDFLIAREALARSDLAYTGMIGSATKRATFSRWLLREGGARDMLQRLILPIGGQTVRDKRPAVIAALVAAELLQAFASHAARRAYPADHDHA